MSSCFFFLIEWHYSHIGASWIGKIHRKKEKHTRARQVMNELVQRASLYKYDYHTGVIPHGRGNIRTSSHTEKGASEKRRVDSAILIAAKMGVTEMVEEILDTYPVAIHDLDSHNKNVVLLAIEHRQPHVYRMLNKRSLIIKESAFSQLDNHGNSALHLAATYRSHKPWRVPGAAMQMQWEYKWYKVKIIHVHLPNNFRNLHKL